MVTTAAVLCEGAICKLFRAAFQASRRRVFKRSIFDEFVNKNKTFICLGVFDRATEGTPRGQRNLHLSKDKGRDSIMRHHGISELKCDSNA